MAISMYRYQVSEETKSLQRIDRVGRKPVARAWVPREVRDSIVARVLKHGESLRQAAYKAKISEREAFDVILQYLYDEQQKAVRIAILSAPYRPTPGPGSPCDRRAA